MALFAHRFVTREREGTRGAPGLFDERRGLRIDADGNPVASGSTGAAPTRGDVDRADALTQLSTWGDVDPERETRGGVARTSAPASLGPIKTSADVDENRGGWH